MYKSININISSHLPVYKQIVDKITERITSGELMAGDPLPSMNELAKQLNISRETTKKAYSLLRKLHYIEATQGKGFFVTKRSEDEKLNVLVLFDKLSTYKQVLFDSFNKYIKGKAEITIRIHNQDIDVFEKFIDENLDKYDYYVITANFPLKQHIHKKELKILKRIPNRKLILLDKNVKELTGNYGTVYQDFSYDVFNCLTKNDKDIKKYKKIIVIYSTSLYIPYIKEGIIAFCNDSKMPYEFYSGKFEDSLEKKTIYLILNGQLDNDLINLVRAARKQKLKIGKDIAIISYNESPINEIILNGLTTISTDFEQMGELAAKMILENKLQKVKCNFKMTRRGTF